jgi:hypothetical protein
LEQKYRKSALPFMAGFAKSSVATSFRGCVKTMNIIDLNLKLNSSKLPLPLGEGWGEGQQNILFSTFHTASLTHGTFWLKP